MLSVHRALLVLAALGVCACSAGTAPPVTALAARPAAPAADPVAAADGPDLRGLWSQYAEALEAGDAARLAGFFTPDAVLMEPNQPNVGGRDAIRRFLETVFATVKILDARMAPAESYGGSDMVTELGTYTEVYSLDGKAPVEYHGRYVAVWRRDVPTGAWLLHRLMVSGVEPATAGS